MPVHTSRIGWLGFCMFWLSFVYLRSHSGWIGRIGEFRGAVFFHKQAYRYPIPLYPDLHSIYRKRLALLMPFHTSGIGWLVFWYVLTEFCIPQVPFRLNWADWSIYSIYFSIEISLPVLHPSLPWLAFNMKEKACFSYARSYQSDRVTCFLYELTEFCIPQVPSRLNWANWRIWRSCI